ncbi:MAG TPA: hypothetical protein VLE73_05970 [Candidatus Saccharimonadales bacterium]|nr:hypothetical protein [Candidatus Saccharimonadales bacterium]
MSHKHAATGAVAPVVRAQDLPLADSIEAGAALAASLRKQEQENRADDAERKMYEYLRIFFGVATNEAVHARLQAAQLRDIAAETIGCLLSLRAQERMSLHIDHTLALLEAATEVRMRRDLSGVDKYPRFMLESMRYALEAAHM